MKTFVHAVGILVLIVVVLGFIVVSGPRGFNGDRFGGPISRAEVQMDIIEQCIERYFLRHRTLPRRLDQLTEPHERGALLTVIPTDPWGNPFRYLPLDDTHFVLSSRGEDGEPPTSDEE